MSIINRTPSLSSSSPRHATFALLRRSRRLALQRLNRGLKARSEPGFTTEGADLESAPPDPRKVNRVRALLRELGEHMRQARLATAGPVPEGAHDAAHNRALVANDENASAWRHGHMWRPEDRASEWTPERRQRSRETLARNLEARRLQEARA